MKPFTANINRNASASIAGYVYQMELTILRWLELQAGEVLVVEQGEDIDKVSSSLVAGPEGLIPIFQRRNEQAKKEIAPISLGAEVAREALANFAKQREDNKEWDLYFRFTTTAPVTYEQKNRFPKNTPAILKWEALRRHEITDPTEQTDTLNRIRSILTALSKPSPEFNQDTWDSWRRFITSATDTELLDFIRRFEWGCGAADLDDTHEQVLQSIAQRTGFGRPLSISLQRKLFAHVARILSRKVDVDKEDRVLTFEGMQRFIDHPVLETSETALLGNLQLLLVGFEELRALFDIPSNVHINISPTDHTIYARIDLDADGNAMSIDDIQYADSPEGDAARQALNNALLVGGSFNTDFGNITFPLPDIVASIMPKTGSYEASFFFPGAKQELFCRVEFRRSNDGEQSAPCCKFDVMHLSAQQPGMIVTLFSNEVHGRQIGLQLALALSSSKVELGLDFRIKTPMNVLDLAKAMELQDCLSEPFSITFINLEDGNRQLVFRDQQGKMPPPNAHRRSAVELLAAIARRVGVTITWPSRNLTQEEGLTLDRLKSIQNIGYWRMPASPDLQVNAGEGFKQNAAATGAASGLWVPVSEDYAEIFGTRIPLGKVQHFSAHDGTVLVKYLDWEPQILVIQRWT